MKMKHNKLEKKKKNFKFPQYLEKSRRRKKTKNLMFFYEYFFHRKSKTFFLDTKTKMQ